MQLSRSSCLPCVPLPSIAHLGQPPCPLPWLQQWLRDGHSLLGPSVTHVGEEGPVQLEDLVARLLQGDIRDAMAARQVEGDPHGPIQVHEVDVHLAPVWVVDHVGEEHQVSPGERTLQQWAGTPTKDQHSLPIQTPKAGDT